MDEKEPSSDDLLRNESDGSENRTLDPSNSPSIIFRGFVCLGLTYTVLPLIFLVFGGPILRELTYLNHLHQKTCDINEYFPNNKHAYNVDIESSKNTKIAAWYFKGDPSKPFLIYSHGNAASRCGGYRLVGYKKLIDRGYSVLAYDYGGFSNSTTNSVLTDESLVQDLLDVEDFVRKNYLLKDQTLILWGHSLGTAVTAASLNQLKTKPDIVVLDSPFSSFEEMVKGKHFLSIPFKAMYRSFWDYLMEYEMKAHQVGVKLETRSNLLNLGFDRSFKLIIAHSEDDFIIPFSQSEKLVDSLKPVFQEKLSFYKIDGNREIGHNYIMGRASDEILDEIESQ